MGTKARSVKHAPRWILGRALGSRLVFFLVVPLLLLRINPVLVGYIFLVIYGLRYLVEGCIDILNSDLLCRLVEPEERGALIGTRSAVGSALSLLSSYIIAIILGSRMHPNDKYAWIFGLGVGMLTVAALAIMFIKDKPRLVVDAKDNPAFGALLKRAVRRIKNKQLNEHQRNYAAFVIFRVLQVLSNAGILLSLLLIKRAGNLTSAQVGLLIFVQTAGRFIGGFMWGRISKKLGNKRTIILTQILTVPIRIIAILLLVLMNAPGILSWILAFMAGLFATSWVGSKAYMLDILPEDSRTLYFSIDGLMNLPLAFVSALAGLLAERFGFLPLQVGTLALAVLSIVAAVVMLKPREQLLIDAENEH